jgi:hypothetical protein
LSLPPNSAALARANDGRANDFSLLPPLNFTTTAVPLDAALAAAMEGLSCSAGLLDYSKQFALERADELIRIGKNPYNLSRDQLAALVLYTTEVIYTEMNEKLRKPDRREAKPFLPLISLMMSAAKKYPKTQVNVYRGLTVDLHDSLVAKQGRDAVWWHFSSCTLSQRAVLEFAGAARDRTVLMITTRSAIDISSLSAYEDEKELLLFPGACLQVMSVVRDERQGVTHAMLEEKPHLFL